MTCTYTFCASPTYDRSQVGPLNINVTRHLYQRFLFKVLMETATSEECDYLKKRYKKYYDNAGEVCILEAQPFSYAHSRFGQTLE